MPKTCFPNLVQVAMVTMLLSMVFVEEIISGFTGSTPSCYYHPPYNCPSSKDGQKRQLRKIEDMCLTKKRSLCQSVQLYCNFEQELGNN
ncbi:hypothetical protein pdam_00015087 [Pocillopora damicornis]|uniref:Uncharacterized protein n=1 Tax=Pocillopora damicornis TaxID=46731 RepID=A0A3M6UMI8_POCDA|nr:hypothetical protein pdam_00015087 [Pocillopora damicornis]